MGRRCLAFALSFVLVVPSTSSEIPTPDDVLSEGQCWSEAGQSWEEQVEACSDIIDPRLRATPSGRAKALFNRGWARVFLCQYDRAITDFGLATRIGPDVLRFREGLAEAVRRKQFYARAERDLPTLLSRVGAASVEEPDLLRLQLAIRDLREAVALVPSASAVHLRLADDLLQAGLYHAALDEFTHGFAVDERNDRFLLGRAEARLALGDADGARDDVMVALRRMSSCPCGGRLLARMGRRAGRLH
jgi:tetratricopeptide (TPR) repeat protein